MDKESYVYILASRRNGTLYVGVTTDLAKRAWQHKNKMTKGFTSKYHIDKLVYYEVHGDVMTAIEREKSIKGWCRSWKLNLIEGKNPTWRDLYEEVI